MNIIDEYYICMFISCNEEIAVELLLLLSCDDEFYHIQYRFRTVLDDKIFDSKDIKRFGEIKANKSSFTEYEAKEKALEAIQLMTNAGFSEPECIEINGNSQKFIKVTNNHPYFHTKVVTDEKEIEKYRENL